MERESIFTTPHCWQIAEGVEANRPVLYRNRQIPDKFVGTEPQLLVLTLGFIETDDTGLPTRHQYDQLEEFESRVLDKIESQQLGVVAFTWTYRGTVRYFLYVSELEPVLSLLSDSQVAIAACDDPNWDEFRNFLNGLESRESNRPASD
jgi:hypothetical protein